MQQTLVREECSGHRGIRMVDPTHNLVLLGDAPGLAPGLLVTHGQDSDKQLRAE
jgi:hypothetical protein